jgi:uncharacterized protein YecE (DUF72 family)
MTSAVEGSSRNTFESNRSGNPAVSHRVRIGTSGWNYDHWKGRFYPEALPQKRWFAHYCDTFDTVEINNTFYHQPDDETYDAWRRQAPSDFIYSVKANRYLTHLRKLNEPAEPLKRFLKGARRLDEHLGPILFQLPPHWHKNLERLDAFAQELPAELTHVIEFRDRDWLADDTYRLMANHDLCLCVHDMLARHPRRVTGAAVYIRFHGTGDNYGGKYRPSRLRGWADWINEVARQHEVFVYFNNDADAHAVRDAQTLREMIT